MTEIFEYTNEEVEIVITAMQVEQGNREVGSEEELYRVVLQVNEVFRKYFKDPDDLAKREYHVAVGPRGYFIFQGKILQSD